MARNKYPEQTVEKILDVSEKLFIEKGYDNTSIQNIIDGLGGLSKGAIYHHFRSKEEIFYAVADRYNRSIVSYFQKMKDDTHMTGFEKLKKMFALSLGDKSMDFAYVTSPDFVKNPELISMLILEIFTAVAPDYMEPVIRQGIEDGSIQVDYPKEISEMICTLTNVWMNPALAHTDAENAEQKVRSFAKVLDGIGLKGVIDEDMVQMYVNYIRRYNKGTK